MGLLQSTMEVTENESVVHQNVNSYERNIEQFNLNQVNKILDDLQTKITQNFKIFENNNLTKTTLDENIKTTKSLLAKVYTFIQDMRWDLNAFLQLVDLSNGTYNYKAEHIRKLENKYLEQMKLLEILEMNKLHGESFEIKVEICKTDQKKYQQLREKVKDECDEEEKTLQTSKLNLETLQLESEEFTRTRESDDNSLKRPEQLDKKCEEVETKLRQVEIDSEKQTEELNAEFHLKKKIIKGKETALWCSQANIKKMGDEIAHLNAQITAIKDEFVLLSFIFEGNEEIDFEKNNIEKAIEQKKNKVKELNAKAIALNLEFVHLEQELKNMTLQVDNVKNEIQRLKASKDKKVTVLA